MAQGTGAMVAPPRPPGLPSGPTTIARRVVGGLAMPLGSVVFAFVVGGLIVAVTGGNPFSAYAALICGGFGIGCPQGENPALQISNTIVFLAPLIATGVAVALPFRAGLFNIGAEGQLLAGSMACTAIGIKFSTLPTPVLLPMVLVGGMVAGALWAGVAGVLKATVGAHEVVTTIMMNYIAQWLLRYLIIGGPLQLAAGTPKSSPIGAGARLPTIPPNHNSPFIFRLPSSVFPVPTRLFLALAAVAGVPCSPLADIPWLRDPRRGAEPEGRALRGRQRAPDDHRHDAHRGRVLGPGRGDRDRGRRPQPDRQVLHRHDGLRRHRGRAARARQRGGHRDGRGAVRRAPCRGLGDAGGRQHLGQPGLHPPGADPVQHRGQLRRRHPAADPGTRQADGPAPANASGRAADDRGGHAARGGLSRVGPGRRPAPADHREPVAGDARGRGPAAGGRPRSDQPRGREGGKSPASTA